MTDRFTHISGYNAKNYKVCRLTKQIASTYSNDILNIHNIIPYVRWGTNDLLADVSPRGIKYGHKWDLSFAVFHQNQVVGFLVAYLRPASDTHPVESVYIHRLAVAPIHQGNGIGTQLLAIALKYYAHAFPDISTYTVQTNDEMDNIRVIEFYQNAGFQRFLPVYYPEKLDVLMRMEKDSILNRNHVEKIADAVLLR